MIKNTVWVVIFQLVCIQLYTQVGLVRSAYKDYSEPVIISLPELDNQALQKKYNQEKGYKPFRFAEPRDVYLNIKEDGQWEQLKSGKIIWRQILNSAGAYSINLAFSKFQLEGNAELYIYDPEMTEVYGPFTKMDNEDHRQLWTPMVPGDKIVIELQCDPADLDNLELELFRLNHDFVDIRKSFVSGDCNLDVICGAADGWPEVDKYRDIISSVGAYTINGIDQCSGVLINNTSQDCRPFFLTADHCDIEENNAQSVVVYWKYENSYCRQPGSIDSGRPGDGQRNNFNSGAIHRASLQRSDFTLIELDDPVDPHLNLFFSGWDLNSELPDSSICIHHPGVEEKRISFEFDKLLHEINGQDTFFIMVSDWDIGTTEGGSSGSPLYNPEKRIIGQLQGGFAACGNDEFDSYGWFRHSWFGDGDSTNSLSYWLDPNNSGYSFLDGKSCSFNLSSSVNFLDICGRDTDEIMVVLNASEFFDEIVDYTIEEASAGLELEFEFDQGSRTESNVLTISGFSGLPEDDYVITVKVSDGMNEAQTLIEIYNYTDSPEVPSPSSPSNNSIDQDINLELLIDRPGRVINHFELALDESFNTVIESTITETRKMILSNLEAEQTYYWRVKSSNACGESEWSEIFSFTTAGVFCTQLRSTDGPVLIDPGGSNTVISTISVPYPAIVQDVNILNLRGTHDYVSDLQMTLDFNDRKSILMKELCDDSQDFNLGFDDEAMQIHIPCPPTDSMMYVPSNSLSVYDNMISGGEWEMVIDDLANFDGGEFEEWTLQICISEALAPSIIPDRHSINYCEAHNINFTVFYELGDFGSDYEIKAYDRNDSELLIEVFEHHGSANTSSVRINTDGINEDDLNVRLELISLPSQAVVAISAIRLIKSGTAMENQITWPENDLVIKPESLSYVEWSDSNADSYNLQISQYPDFGKLLVDEFVSEGTAADISRFLFEEGEYYIRLIGHHNCGDIYSETVRIILDDDTNVQDLELTDISIHPNPTRDHVYIQSNESLLSDFELTIYSIQGQIMEKQIEINDARTIVLSMASYPQGMYILRFTNETSSFKASVIKF